MRATKQIAEHDSAGERIREKKIMTNHGGWHVPMMPRALWLMAWYIALTAIAYIVLLLFVAPYRPTTFTSWLLFAGALLPVAWLADSASARDRRSVSVPEAAIGSQPLPSAAISPAKRRAFEQITSDL
jgi:hypothetical protein